LGTLAVPPDLKMNKERAIILLVVSLSKRVPKTSQAANISLIRGRLEILGQKILKIQIRSNLTIFNDQGFMKNEIENEFLQLTKDQTLFFKLDRHGFPQYLLEHPWD
jgi:hypothetical protein